MIKSMTGYGKAEAALESGKLTVEIRTLNGKSADISVKSSLLPKEMDLPLRRKIADALVRGTIDVYLSFEPSGQGSRLPVDTELLKEYYSALSELRESLPKVHRSVSEDPYLADNLLLTSLLRLPDITGAKKSEAITAADSEAVEKAFDDALAAVDAYRRKEGAALYRDVTSRIATILSLYDEIERLDTERTAEVRVRLAKSLEDLKIKVDPSRFEQEMIFYLEKLDINEEKVRLRQHCSYFMETIDGEPYPGKKLGVIIQEMGREINTTGSKANFAPIQKLVVRAKDELEKIREQSMNIL